MSWLIKQVECVKSQIHVRMTNQNNSYYHEGEGKYFLFFKNQLKIHGEHHESSCM